MWLTCLKSSIPSLQMLTEWSPVSLGCYYLLSTYISSFYSSYLYFPYSRCTIYNLLIHCFQVFMLLHTVSTSWNVMAQFLTLPSTLYFFLYAVSEPSVYFCHEIYLNVFTNVLFTCLSSKIIRFLALLNSICVSPVPRT